MAHVEAAFASTTLAELLNTPGQPMPLCDAKIARR
jgi:hypothetical protein